MADHWTFMNLKLNPDELPTMRETLDSLERDGGTDAALERLREEQQKKYRNDLIWRYPISQGDSAGGFILPVREGILWIPFDEMEKEAGEILLTNDAELLGEDACAILAEDLARYSQELFNVLQQSARITHRLEAGVEKTLELGTFQVVSGKLAVSDPCYEVDVWCRGELENVKNGTWRASAIEQNAGRWGKRISRLIAVHEEHLDETEDATYTGFPELAPFEVGVDSGQAGIFDAAHYRDASILPEGDHKHLFEGAEAEPWYDYCCDITLSDLSAGVLPYGCVSSSGYGDGGYDCFFWKDDDGKVIRVEIEFIADENDADDEQSTDDTTDTEEEEI